MRYHADCREGQSDIECSDDAQLPPRGMNSPVTQTRPISPVTGNSTPTAAEERSADGASDAQPTKPPRARLVLRVGVVGHRPDPKKRPDPDVPKLRETCRKLLLHIRDNFAGVAEAHRDLFEQPVIAADRTPSGLRLISSLAEGSDQWVAAEAEKLGYELQAVLPFERDEYEKDFDAAVLEEHRRLRALATAVFELDGSRAREGDSYLAAGRVLLGQTDLLIALWDGKDPQGTGGTGQIVKEALQRGIPTVWVNWECPGEWSIKWGAWRLLRQQEDLQDDLGTLSAEVAALLAPPGGTGNGEHTAAENPREQYFAERQRSWTPLGWAWNCFRALVCGKPRLPQLSVPDFMSANRKDWRDDWQGREGAERKPRLPEAINQLVEKSYLPHYAWANGLSVYYANLYRSSFLLIYLLGALAVLLALIVTGARGFLDPAKNHTTVFQAAEKISIGVEFFVILAIIWLTWYGKRQRWHERWIDYRTMAEQLRVAGFNGPLGGAWYQVNVPSHLATYGNPAVTWMHWHARAVQRAAGLPNIAVSEAYLAGFRDLLLEALIAGQEAYHDGNVKRLSVVDHRVHRFGELLFLTTLAACAIHFFVSEREKWHELLILCAAFLPALGAAAAAIRSQGEFHRVVQRSRAMAEELQQLRESLANVPTRPNELDSQLLQQAAERVTRLMYNEVLDWRIVFQDRPLVWPA
jgi:hypothetical protein